MQNFLATDSFSDWNKTLVCLNYPPPVSVSLPPVFSVPSHSQSWQWEQGPPLPGWSGPTSAGDCLSPAPSSSTLSASCLVFLSKVNLNIFQQKEKLAPACVLPGLHLWPAWDIIRLKLTWLFLHRTLQMLRFVFLLDFAFDDLRPETPELSSQWMLRTGGAPTIIFHFRIKFAEREDRGW